LCFETGSAADPAGQAGLAALTARLLTRGTSRRSAPEVATAIETLGAKIGASSGHDFSYVHANSATDVFDETAALWAEIARDPAYTATEVERVKTQLLDELRLARSRPSSVANASISRLVYGAAPYGSAVSGTPKSIPGLTHTDLAAFHRSRWRPSQATLIFSGDIDPDAAFRLAERLFGDWTDASDAHPPTAAPAGYPVAARFFLVDHPGAAQASVRLVQRAIARTDPAYYPLLVANAVLGGGYSARLNRRIRVERGLSYGARSSLATRKAAGLLTAATETRNEAVPEVLSIILGELHKLGTETVTSHELGTRRAALLGEFGRSLETVDGLGQYVAHLALHGLPLSELQRHNEHVSAVTPEQVRAATSQHLAAADSSVVVVGDAARFFDQVAANHPNAERVPAETIDFDSPSLR
ncbi:MAG: pitrilysin family protein, partial [Polyangiales bacterium]